MAPEAPKTGPRVSQDGPKKEPGGDTRTDISSSPHLEVPRRPQEASKRPPRGSQEAPKRPQGRPKKPPRAPSPDAPRHSWRSRGFQRGEATNGLPDALLGCRRAQGAPYQGPTGPRNSRGSLPWGSQKTLQKQLTRGRTQPFVHMRRLYPGPLISNLRLEGFAVPLNASPKNVGPQTNVPHSRHHSCDSYHRQEGDHDLTRGQ